MIHDGETGLVQSISAGGVTVIFERLDACDACGLRLVCAPGKPLDRRLTFPSSPGLNVGQRVQLESISNLELHLALIQLGLPLLFFLAGLFMGYNIPLEGYLPRELTGFLGGMVGIGLSFYVAKKLVRRMVDKIPHKYLRLISLR